VSLDAAIADAVRAAVQPLAEEIRRLTALVEQQRAPTTPAPTLLTVREFATHAGLSQCTVRRRISDGSLSSTRIGASIRIPVAALRPADPAQIATLARAARGGA